MFNKEIRFLVFIILLFALSRPVLAGDFEFFEIQNLELETSVQVKGVVAVEPGVLGQQIFYIDGAQIYSYDKDFPELAIGDEISVQGVVSQSRGEKRIKIKTPEDIRILNRGLAIEPELVEIDRIGDQIVGRLIKIKGLVIEKTGSKIFIADEQNNEATVYIKESAGIDKSKVSEGDEAEIVGILSKYDEELRVLPRHNQDIEIPSVGQSPLRPNRDEPDVQTLNTEVEAKTTSFKEYQPYFIASSAVLGIIFISLLVIKGLTKF